MGFIRNNNVWKINKILAGISGGGVSPEDVQDMIDTSIAPIETAIEGKQDTLTAGDNITIDDNVISASVDMGDWTVYNDLDWTVFLNEDNLTTEDLIIDIQLGGLSFFNVFVPKNTSYSRSIFGVCFGTQTAYEPPTSVNIQLSSIFVTGNTINNVGTYRINVYESNGVITNNIEQGTTSLNKRIDFKVNDKHNVRIYRRV